VDRAIKGTYRKASGWAFQQTGMDLFDEDLLAPNPDIHELFMHYNKTYFDGSLGAVSVEWSSAKMTLCAGTCQRIPGGAIVKLSKPLLALRSTRDLKSTLLHEMIHAYLMVNDIRDDEPSGHGTYFKGLMQTINSATVVDHQRPPNGYGITVHHTMFDEVEHYRKHHWKCEKCGNVVRRAVNRPPQEADCRGRRGTSCKDISCSWHMHMKHCGSVYIKIKEPEGYEDKRGRKRATKGNDNGGGTSSSSDRSITDFFPRVPIIPAISAVLEVAENRDCSKDSTGQQQQQQEEEFWVYDEVSVEDKRETGTSAAAWDVDQTTNEPKKKERTKEHFVDLTMPGSPRQWVSSCPACGTEMRAGNERQGNMLLNAHLDICLGIS